MNTTLFCVDNGPDPRPHRHACWLAGCDQAFLFPVCYIRPFWTNVRHYDCEAQGSMAICKLSCTKVVNLLSLES